MPVNMDKPHLWKNDVTQSVDFYNKWFMQFAPKAYRETRVETTKQVEKALELTKNLMDISPQILRKYPEILSILRMSTAPPIARDRLIGLASVSSNLVVSMEQKLKISPKLSESVVLEELCKIGNLIQKLIDLDIFPWVDEKSDPQAVEIHRAATVVADRLCGAVADPIIRNAQEKRQLDCLQKWLENRGYKHVKRNSISEFRKMDTGSFTFNLKVPILLEGGQIKINIPIDLAVMPKTNKQTPILIECKSAGDFTNTNKRRKEEAIKMAQLKSNYGKDVCFILFLCGYFNAGYLGYGAADGIDWVWEHRIDDLKGFGL